nr:polyprotein [Setosphaeria turcica endornavirus 2]
MSQSHTTTSMPAVESPAPLIKSETQTNFKLGGTMKPRSDAMLGGDGDCWRQTFVGRNGFVSNSSLMYWSDYMVDFHTFGQCYKQVVESTNMEELWEYYFVFTVDSSGLMHQIEFLDEYEVEEFITSHPLKAKAAKYLVSARDIYSKETNVHVDFFEYISVHVRGEITKEKLPFDVLVWDGPELTLDEWILLACYNEDPKCMNVYGDTQLGAVSVLEQISKDYNIPMSMLQNSQLGKQLVDTVNKVAAATVSQSDNRVIEVPATISDTAFNEISNEFGRFKVARVNTGSHPHPYHHASRRAVTKLIVSQYPRSDLLYDVGGDFNYHINQNNFHVHSIFKTGNPTDAARYTNLTKKAVKAVTQRQSQMINKQLSRDTAVEYVLGSVLSTDNMLWCNNAVQDCKHMSKNKATFAMSVDTLMHVEPEDLLSFYMSNNVLAATHALTIPKDFALSDSGKLKYDEGVWSKEDGNLNLVFAGDSTVYSQRIELVERYLYEPILLADNLFMYSRVQGYKAAHLIIEHYMLPRHVLEDQLTKHALWVNYDYDQLVVSMPKILLDRPTTLLGKEAMTMVPVTLNVKFYERLLNRMMQPYTWEALKAYAASCVGRSFVSSSGVEQIWNLNNREVINHCVIAYWSMNRQVEALKPLITRAEERAQPTGFFQQIWQVLKVVLTDIGNEFDPTNLKEVQELVENNSTDDLQLVPMFTNIARQVESICVASQLLRSHNCMNVIGKYVPLVREGEWCTVDSWREEHESSDRRTVNELVISDTTSKVRKEECKNDTCPHNHSKSHRHLAYEASVMPVGECSCCGQLSNLFNDNFCILCAGHEICAGHKATCKHNHKLMHEECCGMVHCNCKHEYKCECCGLPSLSVYCRLCKPNPTRAMDNSAMFNFAEDNAPEDLRRDAYPAHKHMGISLPQVGRLDNDFDIPEGSKEQYAVTQDGPGITKPKTEPLGYYPSTAAHTIRTWAVLQLNIPEALAKPKGGHIIAPILENIREVTDQPMYEYNHNEQMLLGVRAPRFSSSVGKGFGPIVLPPYKYDRSNHVDVIINSLGESDDDGTCGASSLHQVTGTPIATIKEWLLASVGTDQWNSDADLAAFAAATRTNLVVCTKERAMLYCNNHSDVSYAITTTEGFDGAQHWVPCSLKITMLYSNIVTRQYQQYLSLIRYLDTQGSNFEDWRAMATTNVPLSEIANAYNLSKSDWSDILQIFKGGVIDGNGVTHVSSPFTSLHIKDYVVRQPWGLNQIFAPAGFGKSTGLISMFNSRKLLAMVVPARSNVARLVQTINASGHVTVGRANAQWYPSDRSLKKPTDVKMLIFTVDSLHAALCSTAPVMSYVQLLAGRDIYIDEAHCVTRKLVELCHFLGDRIRGFVTATPLDGISDIHSRHTITTNWVTPEAANYLIEDIMEEGVSEHTLVVLPTKSMVREASKNSAGACVSLTSDTLPEVNLQHLTRAAATNTVISGATFPKIKRVIDSGKRVMLNMLPTPRVSKSGTSVYFDIVKYDYTMQEALQSRGRVGRTQPGVFVGPLPTGVATLSTQDALCLSLSVGIPCSPECNRLWEGITVEAVDTVRAQMPYVLPENEDQLSHEEASRDMWLAVADDILSFKSAGRQPVFANSSATLLDAYRYMLSYTQQPGDIMNYGSFKTLHRASIVMPSLDTRVYYAILKTRGQLDVAKKILDIKQSGYVDSLQTTMPVSWAEDAADINIRDVVEEVLLNEIISVINILITNYRAVQQRRVGFGSRNGVQVVKYDQKRHKEGKLFSFKFGTKQPVVIFTDDLSSGTLTEAVHLNNVVDGTTVSTVNRNVSYLFDSLASIPEIVSTSRLRELVRKSTVVSGPPGSGKTRLMMDELRPDVIVSKQSTMISKWSWLPPNAVNEKYKSIGIDEFGMFTVLDLLMLSDKTDKFYFSGDFGQKKSDETSLETARNLGSDILRKLLLTAHNIELKVTRRYGITTLNLLSKLGHNYKPYDEGKTEVIAGRKLYTRSADLFRKAFRDASPTLVITPTNDTLMWLQDQPIKGVEFLTTTRSQGTEAERVMYVMVGCDPSVYDTEELYVAFTRHTRELYILTDIDGQRVLDSLNIKLSPYENWDTTQIYNAGLVNTGLIASTILSAVVGCSMGVAYSRMASYASSSRLSGIKGTGDFTGPNFTFGLSAAVTQHMYGTIKMLEPARVEDSAGYESMMAAAATYDGAKYDMHGFITYLLANTHHVVPDNLIFQVARPTRANMVEYDIYGINECCPVYLGTNNKGVDANQLIIVDDIYEYVDLSADHSVSILSRLSELLGAIKAKSAIFYAYIHAILVGGNTTLEPSMLAKKIVSEESYLPRLWMDASALAMVVDGVVGVYGKHVQLASSYRSAGYDGLGVYNLIVKEATKQGQFLPAYPADLVELHLNAKVQPYGTSATMFRSASGEPVATSTLTLREAFHAIEGNEHHPDAVRAGGCELRHNIIESLVAIVKMEGDISLLVDKLLETSLVMMQTRVEASTAITDKDRLGKKIGKMMKAYIYSLATKHAGAFDSKTENYTIYDISDDPTSDDDLSRYGGMDLPSVLSSLRLIKDCLKSWIVDYLLASCEWAADEEDKRDDCSNASTVFYDAPMPEGVPAVRPESIISLFPCCNPRMSPAPADTDKLHENSRLVEYINMVLKCKQCSQDHKLQCARRNFDVLGTTVNSKVKFNDLKESRGMFSVVTRNDELRMCTIKITGIPQVDIHELGPYYIIIVDAVACMLEPIPGGYKLLWSDHNLMTNQKMLSTAMRLINNIAGGRSDLVKLLKRMLKELTRYILMKKDVIVWTTKAATGVCHTQVLRYKMSAKAAYFALLNDRCIQQLLRLNNNNRCWLQGSTVLLSRRSKANLLDCHTTMIGHEDDKGYMNFTLYAGRESRLLTFKATVEHALGRPGDLARSGEDSLNILRRVGINISKLDDIDALAWLDIVMQATRNNPLSALTELSSDNGYRSISEYLKERQTHDALVALQSVTSYQIQKKIAICIPSGHGKTTTKQALQREFPNLKCYDIDDIVPTASVVRMATYSGALEVYKEAFLQFELEHTTECYLMLCHDPYVVPGHIDTTIVINLGAKVPKERVWSDTNVAALKSHKYNNVSTIKVKNHRALKDLCIKLALNGGKPNITLCDGSELIDMVDDIGGYSFSMNTTGPDSILRLPGDGKLNVPSLPEGLGYQRYYKTGPHVGLSRPTIHKIATSTFNAVSTRLHGIVKLRTEDFTDDEYLAKLSTMFVKDWQDRLRQFSEEPIGLSYDDMIQWLVNKGHKVELLHGMIDDTKYMDGAIDPQRAQAHFKVENLLKEEVNDIMDQTGRIIVWNNQNVNMYLCPMINECKKRLITLLNEDLVSYADGMTMVDINDKLSRIPRSKYLVELDLSKQDRQTDRAILDFEWNLLALLGLDGRVVHYLRKVGDGFKYRTPEGITATRPALHWSGGPMTSLGNEIRNLLLLADLVVNKDIKHILTLGDDSLIFSDTEFDSAQVSLIAAQRHNVGCTFSQSYDTGLFLQLIIGWVGDKYVASHNFFRLREKMAYSSYPSWSASWKAKYASFLMMIGDSDAVRARLSKMGYTAMPALGSDISSRIQLNARHNKTTEDHVLSVVSDIINLAFADCEEIKLPLTMVLPRNKLTHGEVILREYKEVTIDIVDRLNAVMEQMI